MEDIIPLIIVAIISIIGAAANKKKTSKTGEKLPRNVSSFLQNLLDEVPNKENIYFDEKSPDNEEFEEDIKQSNVEMATTEPKVSTANSFNAYSGFLSPEETRNMKEKEGTSVVAMHSKKQNEKVEAVSKNPILEENKEPKERKIVFDLKKAVIYNEILNRKYT